MLDQPSDALTADAPRGAEVSGDVPARAADGAIASDVVAERRRRRTPRDDWRLGGRTVLRWGWSLLAIAFISLGVAMVGGVLLQSAWESPWAATGATLMLWIGMLVPIVWAFSRSRPIGLLRVRWVDLLFAVGLGVLLRIVQGWLEVAAGGAGALPTLEDVSGANGAARQLDVAGVVLAGPVLEEFFFRGVVLVSIYALARRPLGRAVAATVAVLVSSGLFVLTHAAAGLSTVDVSLSVALLGFVCAMLVMLTGRIWAAVGVHIVYNATYVLLALVGTSWG